MSIPMKGLSKRGSYNHLTDSMEFKYFNGQTEISESTLKHLFQVISLNQQSSQLKRSPRIR
jgi:hypothetical protein